MLKEEIQITCPICGKTTKTRNPNQKYCGKECAAHARFVKRKLYDHRTYVRRRAAQGKTVKS